MYREMHTGHVPLTIDCMWMPYMKSTVQAGRSMNTSLALLIVQFVFVLLKLANETLIYRVAQKECNDSDH